MNIDDLVSELRTSTINAIETHSTKEEQLRVLGDLENLQMVCPENEEILAILIPYCEYLNLDHKAQSYYNKLYKLNPNHNCIQQYSDTFIYADETQTISNSNFSNIEIPDLVLKDNIIEEKQIEKSKNPENKQLNIEKDNWSDNDKLSKNKSKLKNLLPILLLLLALIVIIYNLHH